MDRAPASGGGALLLAVLPAVVADLHLLGHLTPCVERRERVEFHQCAPVGQRRVLGVQHVAQQLPSVRSARGGTSSNEHNCVPDGP